MSCNDISVFFHIYKNAGTTIKERYRNNKNYIFEDVLLKKIFWYPHSTYINYLKTEFTNILIGGHAIRFVGLLEKQFENANISYITTLRDPLERIISAYNYYKFKMLSSHKIISKINIIEWFTLFKTDAIPLQGPILQYQQFLHHVPVSEKILDLALEIIKEYKINFIFIDEKDWLLKFDNFIKEKNINCVYDNSITYKNTSISRSDRITNFTINDLSVIEKDYLLEQLEEDYIFYNEIKNGTR